MPRRPRGLRRRSGRLRRPRGAPLRDLPGRQPRPRGRRDAVAGGVLARRRAGGALDAGDDQPADARLPALAPAAGRGRERGPLPRLAARSRVGVRPLGPGRGAVPGRHALPRLADRPLARRAVVQPARGPAGDRLDAPRRRPARRLGRGVADQPRQRRPAARRRRPRRLAGARHDGLDGGMAPLRVRHRGRAGGDPRGARCRTRSPSASSADSRPGLPSSGPAATMVS